MKKIHLIILIIVVALSLVSCDSNNYGFYSDEEKDLYKKVTLLEDENGNQSLVYNEISYYRDNFGFFSVLENSHYINEGDIMLGWTGSPLGVFYTQEYYSYTQDLPMYIYTLRGWEVYFCETYDYRSDTFVIEGTNSKIVFSDAIKEKTEQISHDSKIKVILHSETNPRVASELYLHFENEIWYVSTQNNYYFEITDEFKQLLIENKIIQF